MCNSYIRRIKSRVICECEKGGSELLLIYKNNRAPGPRTKVKNNSIPHSFSLLSNFARLISFSIFIYYDSYVRLHSQCLQTKFFLQPLEIAYICVNQVFIRKDLTEEGHDNNNNIFSDYLENY